MERNFLEGRLEEAAREIANKKNDFAKRTCLAESQSDNWSGIRHMPTLCAMGSSYDSKAGTTALKSCCGRRSQMARPTLKPRSCSNSPATAERLQKERESAIARARQDADQLVKEGKLPEALGLLDRISRAHPDDFDLAEYRRDLEARAEEQLREAQRLEAAERRQAAERARKIASCRAAVDAALTEREWKRALQAIDIVERELPGEPIFIDLRERVRLQRRRHGLEELERTVRQSFSRRDLNDAARELGAAPLDFPEEPLWQSLSAELSRLREYDSLLAEAENLIIAANYQTAQTKLREATSICPADGRAEALLNDIMDESSVKRRRALQIRLLAKKNLPALQRVGIVAVLLLLAGIASRILLRPAPVLITLRPEPAKIMLSYRIGETLPSSLIVFNRARVRFEVSVAERVIG